MEIPPELEKVFMEFVKQYTSNNSQNQQLNSNQNVPQGGKTKGQPIDQLLYKIATKNRNFYYDNNQITYIEIQDIIQNQIINNYLIKIESSDFTRWITRELYVNYKKILTNKQVIDGIKILLSGEAITNGKEIEIHNRIANIDGAIYIDLGTMDRQMVRVTKTGWDVDNYPVFFKRHKDIDELPIPDRGGNLMDIIPYFPPLPKRDQCLALCWLIGSFFERIERAFLLIEGPPGLEKTALSKLLKSFIDPSKSGAVSYNDNVDQMAQLIDHQFLPLVDNVTLISRKVSDLLCSAFSKVSRPKKKLYTDDEDFIFNLSGNIIFTGIKLLKPKGDFLDRCYKIEMKKVNSTYRSKQEFTDRLEKEKPLLFGAVLNTLVKTMNKVEEVSTTGKFRTVDFDRHAKAAAEVMGYGADFFMNARNHSEKIKLKSITNSTPLIEALSKFLKSKNNYFSGYMGKLVKQLPKHTHSPDEIPSNPQALSRRLGEITPELNAAGIYVQKKHNDGKGVLYEFQLIEKIDSSESVSSQDNLQKEPPMGEQPLVNQTIPPETSEEPEPVPSPSDFNTFNENTIIDTTVQNTVSNDQDNIPESDFLKLINEI